MAARTELDALMGQVEEMWANQNTLFTIIDETNDWDHKHGADWTFADVPYHLAYCNSDIVLRPMQYSRDIPEADRLSFATVADIHKWNERRFAERPSGQTAKQSLADLRSSWTEILQVVSGWNDADLERAHWMPFMGGRFLTTRDSLLWAWGHDWSEFMQLRIHMERSEPQPSPESTSHYLATIIGVVYPLFLDKEAARGREFRAVMAFTDLGVNDIIIDVSDGEAAITQDTGETADLVITQSAETFEKSLRGIVPFPELLQSGAILVSDMEALATMGELFPMDLG